MKIAAISTGSKFVKLLGNPLNFRITLILWQFRKPRYQGPSLSPHGALRGDRDYVFNGGVSIKIKQRNRR
ncbi:hypothetical protein KL86APRO_11912 [uncultured Alphaproteobacteria bacterium]|uniref:Uncharacterized protein n=1 Tax=uncultured Alphaproteobacteria bacterium TaxID=91750 RepID=A0A212K061_9PROT|nr:hypothetical protein KL86APRO_11912 [uncultured Alphaproteobacteria bacterium]